MVTMYTHFEGNSRGLFQVITDAVTLDRPLKKPMSKASYSVAVP